MLLFAASGFGYTDAVRALVATKPAERVLNEAVWKAAQCGRSKSLEALLDSGAAPTHEAYVTPLTLTNFFEAIE